MERYSLDCFVTADWTGDAQEEVFRTEAEARDRAKRLLAAGRFQSLELYKWEGESGVLIDAFPE